MDDFGVTWGPPGDSDPDLCEAPPNNSEGSMVMKVAEGRVRRVRMDRGWVGTLGR